MNPPQNAEHKPVCEKHKDCHLMISSAKECFWPPCVRIGCHKHRQYIDEVAPALTEKQWDKLESRSQGVDWEDRFDKEFPMSCQEFDWYGDGHFCSHHPDDPAHGKTCYEHPYKEQLKFFITKELADAIAETREAVLQKAAHLMDDEGAKTGDILTDEATLRTRNFYHAADMIRALLNNLKEDV